MHSACLFYFYRASIQHSYAERDIDIETRLCVCLSVSPLGAGIVQMTETLDVSLGTVVFQTPKILVKFHWGHPQHRVGYNWGISQKQHKIRTVTRSIRSKICDISTSKSTISTDLE